MISTSVTNSPPEPTRAATIRRGVIRLSSRLRAERPPGAMAGNKVSVLGHLNRYGPSTAGAIAAAANQQPQSLSRTFNELQLAGLIIRRPGELDRREVILSLTDAGRQALIADMASRDSWLQEALDSLSEAEAEILRVAAGLMERLAEPKMRRVSKRSAAA
jgi:DNA-binding MarR family transcriptional regulator